MIGTTSLIITDTTFARSSARSLGGTCYSATASVCIFSVDCSRIASLRVRSGAVYALNTKVEAAYSHFSDCSLQFSPQASDPTQITARLGGALYAKGGVVSVTQSTFSRVSALPNDLQLSSCAQVRDTAPGESQDRSSGL